MTARRLHVLALLLAAASVVAACGDEVAIGPPEDAPAPGTPPDSDQADHARQVERWIFDRVNDERAERGLGQLEWDDQLAESARSWSATMAEDVGLEHSEIEELMAGTEGFTGVGENIFRSTGPVPAGEIHVGWMRSDGHRANVLHEDFDRLGVGVLCTAGGATWATQHFGATGRGGAAAPGADPPPEDPIVAEDGAGPTCG